MKTDPTQSDELLLQFNTARMFLAEEEEEEEEAHIVVSLLDVTERKRAEEELLKAKERAELSDKLKDAFIANMSHEIRTPLNIIMGYSGIIEELFSNRLSNQEQGYFRSIERGGTRLMRTVEHILNISSIQAGTFSLQKQKLDVHALVDRLILDMQPIAREKGLFLECVHDNSPIIIEADMYAFDQAMTNLIDNAIKFTAQGGVFIRVEQMQNTVSITVRDTGIGISQIYLPKVFDTFSQEAIGYSRPFEGLGLGMALTKRYVEMNGGTIEIESIKDKGSTFTIRFPVSEGVQLLNVPSQYSPVKGHGSTRKKREKHASILVVEDDDQSQQYMRTILSGKYDIVIAASANEAWDALESTQFNLIFMDLALRGNVDGLQLTTQIRNTDTYKMLPIIALTAHAFPEDREKSLQAGCDDYISKPFQRAQLIEVIEKYIP